MYKPIALQVTKSGAITTVCQFNPRLLRFATQAAINVKPQEIEETSWENARPYSDLPGPSKWELIKFFRPGGSLRGKGFRDVQTAFLERYGNICKIPGILGKIDNVLVYEPDDMEKVFRSGGAYPTREGFETLTYHRKVHRKNLFEKTAGLTIEQGEAWWDFRQKVNPVMMMPKSTKAYVPKIDEITMDFVMKLHSMRGVDNSAPDEFLTYLKKWSLESISYISMDIRIGLLGDTESPTALKFMDNLNRFFEYSYQLDVLPSIWKLYKTPMFKKAMKTLDEVVETAIQYLEQGKQALEELKKSPEYSNPDRVKGVLEKLLEIDETVALVMTMDSIIAGVDTTSTSAFNLLYNLARNPDKQEILRKELLTVLPEKDSKLTAENMAHMPYFRACMKESSRVSPIFGIIRSAGYDMVIQGHQIPKGTNITMANEWQLMNEQQYDQCDKFIPERFIRNKEEAKGCPVEKVKEAHPFINLPFGYGPRMCIGRRFAELEIEALVSRLIRTYNIEWRGPPPEYSITAAQLPTGKTHFYFEELDK